jgi:hypothetical protein
MKHFLLLLIAASGSLWLGHAEAHAQLPPPHTVSLLEETPLYNSPDESDLSGAALAPQDVSVIDAEPNWDQFFGTQRVWLKIQTTWMGDQWLLIHADTIGTVIPKNELAYVSGPIALYDSPIRSSANYIGTTLESGNITVKAWFDRPQGAGLRTYLVETPNGDHWFLPYDESVIEPLQPIHRDISAVTAGTIFAMPYSYSYSKDKAHYSPQTFHAFEQYKDFYHVRGDDGNEFWINLNFAQPTATERIDRHIELFDVTKLYEYPNDQTYMNAVLAPQQVDASEKYTDAWGNDWVRIASYAGDAWLLLNGEGEEYPRGISDSDEYIRVLTQQMIVDPAQSEVGQPLHAQLTGRVKLVKPINQRRDSSLSFQLRLVDSTGTGLGETTVATQDIHTGEEIPFSAVIELTAPLPEEYAWQVISLRYVGMPEH